MVRSDGSDILTGGQLRKLHAALEIALETTAQHTTAEIDTTFQQENAASQIYLCIVILRSDPGLDTKLTMRPFLRYLDTDDVLELNIGKLDFSITLTTKVMLWKEWEDSHTGRFKACCLEQESSELVQVYTNKDIIMSNSIPVVNYQSLSRLLYCNQLHLNEAEYFMSSGMVTVNVTDPMISISDYNKVSTSQVRVCADTYLHKSQGKDKPSGGAFARMSNGLLISSLVSMVINMGNFY